MISPAAIQDAKAQNVSSEALGVQNTMRKPSTAAGRKRQAQKRMKGAMGGNARRASSCLEAFVLVRVDIHALCRVHTNERQGVCTNPRTVYHRYTSNVTKHGTGH